MTDRWSQRIEDQLGQVLLGLVPMRDNQWLRNRRRSIVKHAVVFAIGVLMTQALGLGWAIVPLAALVHLFLFEPKRVLIASARGLYVIELRPRSVEVIAEFALGAQVSLTLRSDQPQVGLSIDQACDQAWEATVNGNDLSLAEEVIRSGGAEPVRIKRQSER